MKENDKQTDLKKLTEKASRWVVSEKGQKAIQDAFQRAADESARIEEAQKVKPDTLLEPVTL